MKAKTLPVTVQRITIHESVEKSIKKHARREADKGKYEAVGFVARSRGEDGEDVAVATLPLHNHASNPTEAFFVEPWEQFRAERTLDQQDYGIVGVYHSHVNSEALPSQADHKLARPKEFCFIYSVIFDDLRAYYREDEHLMPVEIVYAK